MSKHDLTCHCWFIEAVITTDEKIIRPVPSWIFSSLYRPISLFALYNEYHLKVQFQIMKNQSFLICISYEWAIIIFYAKLLLYLPYVKNSKYQS